MDKSSIVKLRNYFSDRIEEIKEGSYVPTYEQIKELPKFRGINRETFRIARKRWYKQHFQMTPVKFSSRVELIKAGYTSENKFAARLENIKGEYISEMKYHKEQRIKRKRDSGFCCLCPGVLFIVWGLLSWLSLEYTEFGYTPERMMIIIIYGMVPGIILLSIGIFLILHNRSKASKN